MLFFFCRTLARTNIPIWTLDVGRGALLKGRYGGAACLLLGCWGLGSVEGYVGRMFQGSASRGSKL